MKKLFIMVLVGVLMISFLIGCSMNIDTKTTVKRIDYFKTYPSNYEFLILEVDKGSILVWSPEENLKKFLSQIKPGDIILLKAFESESCDKLFWKGISWSKFHIVTEIIKLSDGARYNKRE